MKNIILLIAFTLTLQLGIVAQESNTISLEEIMSGNSFIGHQPFDIKWSADGNSIFYSVDTDSTNYSQIYQYFLKSKKTHLTSIEERKDLNYFDVENKFTNSTFQLHQNELFYCDSKTNKKISVIKSNQRKSELQQVSNSKKTYFRQNNNLFSYDYSTGSFKQITNFIKNSNTKEEKSDYFTKEQSVLFDYYKGQQKLKSLPESNDFSISVDNKSLNSIQISPNEEFIVYRTSL